MTMPLLECNEASALRFQQWLLALNDLLNNDRFVQHCSDPRLNSLQLRHAAKGII
jgi:hypothetical protein